MTAVSHRSSETASDLVQDESQRLRWVEQGFVFEISSPDRKVLEMARSVFAVRSPGVSDITTRLWKIDRLNPNLSGTDTWLVSGTSESSSMLPVRAESRETAILHVEQDALEWLLHNFHDAIIVHAALLSKNGKGVVIVGPSFAGKSTLAIALWRNGWSLMCDDIVFIDTFARAASPAPRRVSLRYESKDLVGESAWYEISNTPSCLATSKGLFFHPQEVSGIQKQRTTPLSAIFFLARIDTVVGAAEVRPINPARGALALIPYAFNVRTLPFVEGLRRITPLVDEVSAYDLGRGDLQSMVDAVEVTVG
jgi:hypothetical protein